MINVISVVPKPIKHLYAKLTLPDGRCHTGIITGIGKYSQPSYPYVDLLPNLLKEYDGVPMILAPTNLSESRLYEYLQSLGFKQEKTLYNYFSWHKGNRIVYWVRYGSKAHIKGKEDSSY